MTLANDVAYNDLRLCKIVQNRHTGHFSAIAASSAKLLHGKHCKCEACSEQNMAKSKDPRKMKAMVTGPIDQGGPRIGSAKMKADFEKGVPKVKQVAPPKSPSEKMKPSQLMHDKGKILGKKFSDPQRKKLAHEKKAEPDGSFPIDNKGDLGRAKHALGRSKDIPKTRAWINKRAKQLNAPKLGD